MKIRSITLFTKIAPQISESRLADLGRLVGTARQAFVAAGYEVQTVRLATQALPALAESVQAGGLPAWASELEAACAAEGFEYLSLGPAPLELLLQVPDLLAATRSVFVTAHILDPGRGVIDGQMIRAAAQVIQAAAEIEDGFGNLRFGALANVPAGVPFFPAAYSEPTSGAGDSVLFALATEAADLALDAARAAGDIQDAHDRLVRAIEHEGRRLTAVAEALAAEERLRYGGIDFSLAPFPSPGASIGATLEALSGAPLGCPGTLAAAATLTDAIERAAFPHTGFCGLMLPVLEDAVLAQRSAEGRLGLGELLQWSAVCGTGLDTVPLPGDAAPRALERLLYDVAALSARLHKPLTARLMPLPGKRAGDPVHFDFAYFADGGVLALEPGGAGGLLAGADALQITQRNR
ncbi:MAG: DUF711 family protein [Anaerolineae bacterium]|nr:DUF711 family protein [Anaerolineae bacterium]